MIDDSLSKDLRAQIICCVWINRAGLIAAADLSLPLLDSRYVSRSLHKLSVRRLTDSMI